MSVIMNPGQYFGCPPYIVCYSDDRVVWKEILSMQDPVTVKYEVLEGLFSQKVRAKAEKQEAEKKKEPTEVSARNSVGEMYTVSAVHHLIGQESTLK